MCLLFSNNYSLVFLLLFFFLSFFGGAVYIIGKTHGSSMTSISFISLFFIIFQSRKLFAREGYTSAVQICERGDMSRNYVSMSRGNTKCRNSSRKAPGKVESTLEKYYYYYYHLTFRATTRACQICTAVIG